MEYLEFKELLIAHLFNAFKSEDISITESLVHKANQTLEGLVINRDGHLSSPTIYPSILYENFKSNSDIVEIMLRADEMVQTGFDYPPEVPEFTYENACTSVYFSLVNTSRNAELIKDYPHIGLCDLSAIPRWYISDQSSFFVSRELLSDMNLSEDELLLIASQNTEEDNFNIVMLPEMIPGLDPVDYMDCDPILVVTTKNGIDGCRAILSKATMEKVSLMLGTDRFYVIPSSRHEILVLNPQSSLSKDELKEMIFSINAQVVSDYDYLSDSLYLYDVASHDLSYVN